MKKFVDFESGHLKQNPKSGERWQEPDGKICIIIRIVKMGIWYARPDFPGEMFDCWADWTAKHCILMQKGKK